MKLTLCGRRRNRVLAPVGSFGYRRGARQPRMTIGAVSAISASQLYARTKLGKMALDEHPLDHRLRQSVPLQCLIIECIEH